MHWLYQLNSIPVTSIFNLIKQIIMGRTCATLELTNQVGQVQKRRGPATL